MDQSVASIRDPERAERNPGRRYIIFLAIDIGLGERMVLNSQVILMKLYSPHDHEDGGSPDCPLGAGNKVPKLTKHSTVPKTCPAADHDQAKAARYPDGATAERVEPLCGQIAKLLK